MKAQLQSACLSIAQIYKIIIVSNAIRHSYIILEQRKIKKSIFLKKQQACIYWLGHYQARFNLTIGHYRMVLVSVISNNWLIYIHGI